MIEIKDGTAMKVVLGDGNIRSVTSIRVKDDEVWPLIAFTNENSDNELEIHIKSKKSLHILKEIIDTIIEHEEEYTI